MENFSIYLKVSELQQFIPYRQLLQERMPTLFAMKIGDFLALVDAYVLGKEPYSNDIQA